MLSVRQSFIYSVCSLDIMILTQKVQSDSNLSMMNHWSCLKEKLVRFEKICHLSF